MWWFSKLSIYILLFESMLVNIIPIETLDYDNNAAGLADLEDITINGKC